MATTFPTRTLPAAAEAWMASDVPVSPRSYFADVRTRLLHNRAAVASMVVLGLLILACAGAVLVSPYERNVGDVTDRLQLTPVAIHEAMCFVETAFKNNPTAPDHIHVPSAVFTTPELAAVGLTEAKALAKGHAIDVYKSTFKPLLHTLGGRPVRTLMKLIVDSKTDKVLGCHIFGDHAAEIIQIVAVCLKMGATKKDFDSTVALHPTAAEELVTMRTKGYSKLPDEQGM